MTTYLITFLDNTKEHIKALDWEVTEGVILFIGRDEKLVALIPTSAIFAMTVVED